MTNHEAAWAEVEEETEKVRAFFEALPEEVRAEAAERLIGEIVIWACRDHYQALGILTEAILWYREASLAVLDEDAGQDEAATQEQKP